MSSCLSTPDYCPTADNPGNDPQALASPVPEIELREQWTRRFGSKLDGYECSKIIRWALLPDATLQARCPLSQAGKAKGYNHVAGCLWRPNACPVASIEDTLRNDIPLRAHEAAHWWLICSWLDGETGATSRPDGDGLHEVDEIWQAGGYVESFRR